MIGLDIRGRASGGFPLRKVNMAELPELLPENEEYGNWHFLFSAVS